MSEADDAAAAAHDRRHEAAQYMPKHVEGLTRTVPDFKAFSKRPLTDLNTFERIGSTR